MKRHFGKWLTAAALAVGCTVMTANAFADTDGHWAESAINKWSGEYGIIQGYDDGTFRPDKSITRGAFAGILDRFLHFQNASPADTFSDTAGTYWEDAILKLHASGIYLGNQGAALPSSTITRQQAVAMIEVAEDKFDTHEYLNNIKNGSSMKFEQRYEKYRDRYVFPTETANS